MTSSRVGLIAVVVVALIAIDAEAHAKAIRIGVVQTVIESTLAGNETKLLGFMDRAGSSGCRVVIFPENALYWPEVSTDKPTKSDLDAAIENIGQRARTTGLYVVFGTAYKATDDGGYDNYGVVYGPAGNRLVFYRKNYDVPERFEVDGVPCNLVVCSDRGYLEHSDLPGLVQGSRIIIDTSGGHGGDDGGRELPWIRYRPWATRTGAYVIVSNPVHDDTDFMGRRPWGGGSAIVRPDGSIENGRRYEKDVMIVEEIDLDRATGSEAERRRNHPILKTFWETGRELLEEGTFGRDTKETIASLPEVKPYVSAVRDIKIAAAQIACSRDVRANTRRILDSIARAAEERADVVVFPELAVTGARADDILRATPSAVDEALSAIRSEAKSRGIYVVVGTPLFVGGARRNCAVVIGDDGDIKTMYAQVVSRRSDLFRAGERISTMWFELKGVHAIVTVGDDADWVEIMDLAACRGMVLHFHIDYESDRSSEAATLRKQRNLLALRYAKYGAVVNAADPSALPRPSLPASGLSMIVSREGGHNRPAPAGLEYYLPYQTSVVKCASSGEEEILFATRKTTRRNDLDLDQHWRNRNRKRRGQPGWHEWMRQGALLIDRDDGSK